MPFEPNGDKVLVRVDQAEEERESGLVVPGAQDEKQTSGEVVNVGPDVENIAADTHVIFSQYGGTAIEVDGEQFTVLREQDILGTLVA